MYIECIMRELKGQFQIYVMQSDSKKVVLFEYESLFYLELITW